MTLMQILEWLEATPIGVMARESAYGFQILVGIHIIGLVFSVGTLVWFDLRLLGVHMRECPVSLLYRRLMPWMLGGFSIMFVSGSFLLAGFATLAYGNFYFRLKVAALLLAGVNAVVYHFLTERHIRNWDSGRSPARPARLAGMASIVLWVVVIIAGRMMSYTMF